MNKGQLFVVTGPSGAGKGTVLSKVFQQTNQLYFSVSATTRAPRDGEVDGVNYHFLTRERFEALISEDRFLEYAQYVEQFYGTPLDPVEEHLVQGDDVLLEIEVQGALRVKRKRPDAILIFIAPPSLEELEHRLRGRGTETEEKIARRLGAARNECAQMDQYQYIVINDKIDQAAEELRAIILASRCRAERRAGMCLDPACDSTPQHI